MDDGRTAQDKSRDAWRLKGTTTEIHKMLNILLVFPHYNHFKEGGSLRSSQIGTFLGKKGHNVTVFAPGIVLRTEQPFPENIGKLFSYKNIDKVRLVRPTTIKNFRKNPFRRILFETIYSLLTLIRCLTMGKMDIAVVAYPPAVAPFFMIPFFKLRKIPTIFEVRDLMAESLTASKYINLKWFAYFAGKIEICLSDMANTIIVVTAGIKKQLVRRGVDPKKIFINSNGYEPNVFEHAEKSFDARKTFGWEKKFVVIYAGGLTQSYDIPTLLKAAQRLSEEKKILFSIVGEGHKKNEYIHYCKKNNLRNVQFIEMQPRNRMPSILSVANVGVHLFNANPLWSIVLGNKTFDYLGSGLPMLYAGTGDTADLIRSAEAGIVVPPENDITLAKAIKWLMQHPQCAQQMGERGKKYVKEHYNRNNLLKEYETILFETLRR